MKTICGECGKRSGKELVCESCMSKIRPVRSRMHNLLDALFPPENITSIALTVAPNGQFQVLVLRILHGTQYHVVFAREATPVAAYDACAVQLVGLAKDHAHKVLAAAKSLEILY